MVNNNRYSKYLAVIALLISVVGVSLGFAAYSNTLQIKAQADYVVDPDNTPDIAELSTDPNPDTPTPGTVTPTVDGATAEPANLTEDGIENISVHFTAPGQSATYSFYGVNPSEFAAYLKTVIFGDKTCTPGTGTTVAYAQNACNDITMTIGVGSDEFTETDNNVVGHTLASGSSEVINVTIEYIDGGATADGPFTVDFGTSTLNYSTVQ